MTALFPKYRELIARSSFSGPDLPAELRLWAGASRSQEVYYAPLEHANPTPRLALVGITPGKSQALLALRATATRLKRGQSDDECLVQAKLQASFGGNMRALLVGTLDELGLNRELRLGTSAELWTAAGYPKALFTSLLPYPTLAGGDNYNASPRASNCDAFREMLALTVKRLNTLPKGTIVLPVGAHASKALRVLSTTGGLTCRLPQIDGRDVYLPHPSGANVESVNLVCHWQHGESAEAYARARHTKYLAEELWREDGRTKPQEPARYLAARVSRWKASHDLRRFFGQSV